MNSLEAVASSAIGIFIPVYLLNSGFSLQLIFVYYLIFSICVPIFFIGAAKFCERYGVRLAFLLRLFFVFLFYATLFLSDQYRYLFFIAPMLKAIETGLMYYPLHCIFIANTKHDDMSKNVSRLLAWPQLTGILMPLISGAIALLFGIKNIFILVFVVYFILIFIYFRFEDHRVKTKFNFQKVFAFFKKYPKYIAMEIFENIREDMHGVVWPIFFYFTIANSLGEKIGIASISSINSISAVVVLLFTLIMGKLANKYNKNKLMKFGFMLAAFAWTTAYFLNNNIYLYLFSIIFSFISVMIELPYQALTYEFAKKDEQSNEFIVFREIPLFFSRTLVYLACILLIANLKTTFILSALTFIIFALL
ncbi:MAG: MFS transporter [Patescibacteria group bacterium]|nr:MFS transporter [Patescibacteria group bacterium]